MRTNMEISRNLQYKKIEFLLILPLSEKIKYVTTKRPSPTKNQRKGWNRISNEIRPGHQKALVFRKHLETGFYYVDLYDNRPGRIARIWFGLDEMDQRINIRTGLDSVKQCFTEVIFCIHLVVLKTKKLPSPICLFFISLIINVLKLSILQSKKFI